jgi:hypothetical protein
LCNNFVNRWKMPELMPLVRGYLESAGFKILDQQSQCLVADKLIFGQTRATWVIWTIPQGEPLRRYEPILSAEISAIRQKYPDATAYVLAQSRSGFSRDFLQEINDKRISLTVPVQFFDAEFKVDQAPKAASAIQDIRSFEFLRQRVAQPYRADESIESAVDGDDLANVLRDRLTNSRNAAVRIIVGRAGIGKSFLFRVLFASLYDEFLKSKQRYELRPRPIPLIPAYLRNIYALRTELLVENFLQTDVASPVSRETFEWLLVNGFTSWFLDGLDELYLGDSNFFDYLADLLTRSGSRAQVTIWCRDSLLTTSDAFAEFRDLCSGTAALEIYHLKEWERPSKRTYTWLRLEDRRPRSGEPDTKRVHSFLAALDSSTPLQKLSGLPFYCQLLLNQFQETGVLQFTDDVAMLNFIVDQMITREVNAGLLDLKLFVPNGLEDWLEEMALAYVEDGRYADIERKQATEYGKLVLRDGIDEAAEEHILTSLVRFPLFQLGTEPQKIAFAHDLIAELLAARGYIRRVPKQAADVGYRLSRSNLLDSAILRFMAARMTDTDERAIVVELHHGNLQGRSLAALLSLLMLARPNRDLIKKTRSDLDAQDLAGIRFHNRDLSGVSFRNTDLSSVTFQDCDLRAARFEGAYLNRTRFEGSNILEDAQFGDLGRAESIFVGQKILVEPTDIRAWLENVTGHHPVRGEPCSTALQVNHIFSKFVTPLGTPRRDDLFRRAILTGRRYRDSASSEECLEQLVQNGYLTGPDYRDRFRRAEGDKYAEIVSYVRDGKVSDSLGRVIAPMCRRRGCTHQVRV